MVTSDEKHKRSQRLLAISDEKTAAFYERHIGKIMFALMEKSKPGTPMHGFTDNYIRIEIDNNDSLDNQLVKVQLIEFNEDRTALKAEILNT